MIHSTAQMEFWTSSWTAVGITSPVTQGTKVALPLMKLSGPDTNHSCSSWLCIIHRPLAWEVNPWGVFNRGYGRIDWSSSPMIWSFWSLSLLAGCLPGILHLKEKKDSKETPQSPTVIIIFLILLNLSVMSFPCLPATIKKPPSVCNADIISCWTRSFKIAWHEAQ